jgi:hypothetical protein
MSGVSSDKGHPKGGYLNASYVYGWAKDDFDLLIYALYPTTGEQFLKWKYGLEEKPR